MGQNWQINPITRDYILNQGSSVLTDDVQDAAYYILTIPRGQWMYGDEGQGSELYLFNNTKRTSSTEQLFAARVLDALNGQLVVSGKAQSVSVVNTESTRQGTANEIDIVPSQSQLSSQLNFTPL
jgi:phage gp46-like protein